MIAADLGAAAAIGSVPLAWALGLLTLPHLVLATLGVGAAAVFLRTAYLPLVPRIVAEPDLAHGERPGRRHRVGDAGARPGPRRPARRRLLRRLPRCWSTWCRSWCRRCACTGWTRAPWWPGHPRPRTVSRCGARWRPASGWCSTTRSCASSPSRAASRTSPSPATTRCSCCSSCATSTSTPAGSAPCSRPAAWAGWSAPASRAGRRHASGTPAPWWCCRSPPAHRHCSSRWPSPACAWCSCRSAWPWSAPASWPRTCCAAPSGCATPRPSCSPAPPRRRHWSTSAPCRWPVSPPAGSAPTSGCARRSPRWPCSTRHPRSHRCSARTAGSATCRTQPMATWSSGSTATARNTTVT